MRQKEKQLFIQLCKLKSDSFDDSLLEYATPHVLGQLFYNRMQAIAYHVLKKHDFLNNVNREFRNSIKTAYEVNLEKNSSFFEAVCMVSKILSDHKEKAAMLKGAVLCNLYPKGCRTSNDIDLLVLPENVTVIGKLLSDAGFKQGHIRNGEFIQATRKEIIESKMLRGETVPYIREINLPQMKYLEVDINFSLDYKNGENDVLNDMMTNISYLEKNGTIIPTLCKIDFFIHLCAHLYKEATTVPWIEMHRDMTLYKYCDIYMLISQMTDAEIENIFVRAKKLGLEKVCAYAIIETCGLFDIVCTKALTLSQEALAETPEFVLQVISPRDKKILEYETQDVTERFFLQNRINDLKEVNLYETTKYARK